MAIEKREPNSIHTINGFLHDPNRAEPVEVTETWNLGHWEAQKVKQGLEALTGKAKENMAYFAWLLGTEGVEITITRKWQA